MSLFIFLIDRHNVQQRATADQRLRVGIWGPYEPEHRTLPSQVVPGGRGMGDVATSKFLPLPKHGAWVWVMGEQKPRNPHE